MAVVTVTWKPNPEQHLLGYNIYIYGRKKGSAKKLNAEPVKQPRYIHKSGAPSLRRYAVVAVNALGQEGIPSHSIWGYWELSQKR